MMFTTHSASTCIVVRSINVATIQYVCVITDYDKYSVVGET